MDKEENFLYHSDGQFSIKEAIDLSINFCFLVYLAAGWLAI